MVVQYYSTLLLPVRKKPSLCIQTCHTICAAGSLHGYGGYGYLVVDNQTQMFPLSAGHVIKTTLPQVHTTDLHLDTKHINYII